ncbi:enhancer of split mgamma protein-like [Dreissena polymorpha]|uniref:enhancer of split mgamma protein-like n=1 Tax=Dreissena polymorpha TaxID=45954 RepID=UPI00226448E2|nr:enhancer of split mgamma protein-like [Dreissena polymorpha]
MKISTIKQAEQEDSSYLRKIRKPLVEKQRRERMNHSIDKLKRLIADTVREQTSPMTRVDKADILDLTVLHLQQLQQRHRSVSMATESIAYTSGFQACAREIITYLTSQKSADMKTIKALSDHLQATQPVPQRKPLVEKQRRERMNHSIDKLKRLIADTVREQTSPMTRVDKADILDLTVLHLQQLQQRHRSVSMATESIAYTSGFQACAREIITYLTSQKSADMKTIKALSDHLQATQPVPQRVEVVASTGRFIRWWCGCLGVA